MYWVLLFLAALFVAYSNGANDNFKGVATLFGSKTTTYKTAIAWATLTTLAGSMSSIFLASGLIKRFSGKGLVPDAIATTHAFHFAVAIATGLTVILATQLGFPISTTHALTGALVGAGLVAISWQVNLTLLQTSFVLPLLLSPILAIAIAAVVYGLAHRLRLALGIQKELCVCVGEPALPVSAMAATLTATTVTVPELTIDKTQNCLQRYQGRLWGIRSQPLIDAGHFLSAGLVSFARGLNDTPKIVALLLVGQAFSIAGSAMAVAVAMAIGGLLKARRVAYKMSQEISTMNPGQGFSANVVTGLLVLAASRFGLPVSTTHVSVGSIFGVGLIAKTAHPQVFYQILLSWVLTLPIAALLSAIVYGVSSAIGG